MKVKLLKDVQVSPGRTVKQGSIYPARRFATSFLQVNAPYQLTDGPLSGRILPMEYCMEVKAEEIVYSEKEWNDLKEHYHSQLKKEKAQLIIFQNLARDLTDTVKKKNQEIEKLNFFLESSNLALRAACEAIETLKAKS